MAYGLLDQGDREQALYQGLLAASAGLLGNGPTRTPQGGLAGFGQAMQGFGQGMAQGRQNAVTNKLTQFQFEDMDRKRKEQEALRAAMAGMFTPPPGAPTVANAQQAPINSYGFSPQQLEMLKALPPEQQAQIIQQKAFAPPVRTKLGPGDVLLDEQNKPIASAPVKPDKPSSFEAALAATGFAPGSPQYQAAARDYIARIGAPPSVTVNNAGQKQLDATEKTFSEFYTNMLNGEMTAPTRLAKLDQLDGLLKNVETGRFGEQRLALGKAAADLGMPGLADTFMKARDSAEAAQSIANEMTLELRNPAGGAGMPGAMSDSDREFLKTMVPSLTTTAEGRKNIIEFRRAMVQRERDVGKLARQYAKENGGRIDEGFFEKLQEFSDKNPLVPRPASPEAANALKPGTMFIDPNGVVRRR